MNPKTSVLMPVYNVGNYVEKAIRSVLSQTETDLELIVINDGSTDDTLSVIQTIHDERIHLFSIENHGVSFARNMALDKAAGNYLMFVDGDDYLEPHILADCMAMMEKRSCDIVTFGYIREGKYLHLRSRCSRWPILTGKEAVRALVQEQGIDNYLWGKLYKKECFDGIRFPEQKDSFEDAYTSYRVLLNAERVGCLHEYGYHYRVGRSGSLTNHMDYDRVSEMRESFRYQERALKKLFPDDDFQFDRQYCNADLYLMSLLVFRPSASQGSEFRPSPIRWQYVPVSRKIAYQLLQEALKIKTKRK
ncbi:glycosyltransferase family 2 protein [Catenisphaera adipataccumulans]|jgi:glycosyltransferase involved in cell wall biosynthesis|uniref:Glycosyltransferase involved in cell wall biosynthesis n=1 Tax=Catenisphaera adipataccumulans TaxID=700500 RepID=A0A7W8D0V0_9FIRM|nr:glycosyltransferase family 2 protein [Catenisphaera adipataccumulans]MBB5183932.1 glycosyltransferase involved in cell wall biosynthesis [Catenisphaera adipataccumulans]